jgi:dynein heavy chain
MYNFPTPASCTVPVFLLHLQILAENNQLRKQADDAGPRAELEHWKKRLSKFNYLLDQLKSPEVKAVLAVLAAAKSKLLKVVSHFFVPYDMRARILHS